MVIGVAPAALAQSNGLGALDPSAATLERMTPDALIQLFAEQGGMTGSLVSDPGAEPIIVEFTAPGGGTVYAAMANCVAEGAAPACGLVELFGYFDASGVTLSAVNQFNLETSFIATAALIPNGAGYVSSKTYLSGGIARQNLINRIGLYFLDVDHLVAALQPGLQTQVNASVEPGAGVVAGVRPDGRFRVNAVGAPEGTFISPALREKIMNGVAARD